MESNIDDILQYLTLANIKLLDLKVQIKNENLMGNIIGIPGGRAIYENDILTFDIPDAVPPIERKKPHDMEITRLWVGYMAHAYRELNITVKFKKVVCFIVMYLPHNFIWDVDNRRFKPILDGLRFLQIVPGDDSKHLTYFPVPFISKRHPRTLIKVVDYQKIEPFLKSFGIENKL